MNKVNNKLRIAIQKRGRLREPSLQYLQNSGFQFDQTDQLIATSTDKATELIFVRNGDIPAYLNFAAADYAIVGQNTLMEQAASFPIIRSLDFGRCELVIAVPANSKIQKLTDLTGERIATSYPNILRQFLQEQGISAAIIEIKGSVEITPKLGLADAIFDITQTGRTLQVNNLRVLTNVTESRAVLVKNPNTNYPYEDLFI